MGHYIENLEKKIKEQEKLLELQRKVISRIMGIARDTLTSYAYWESGTQFVGTTGKKLSQAQNDLNHELKKATRNAEQEFEEYLKRVEGEG